jgi:hypothetical protein
LQTRDVLHAAILQGHLDATRWHGVAIGHTFLLEDPVTSMCEHVSTFRMKHLRRY